MPQAETYATGEGLLGVVRSNRYEAMEKAIAQRLPLFYRTAYRFLGNHADAEDAVQEALLSAYKHLHEFRGEAQISTWLTAIVSNCARMQLRRRPRQLHISLDEPVREDQERPLSELLADRKPNPEDECQKAELRARLREASAQLSPTLRRTFLLRDLEDMPIRQAAKILNTAEGTVKAQLSRARRKLTKSMRLALTPKVRPAASKTSWLSTADDAE